MPHERRPANPGDPRYLRTRDQIRQAVLVLRRDGPAAITFARVAQQAGVNRSTVHQHYPTRQELVADAYATAIADLAEPLSRCPFDRDDEAAPAELTEAFTCARDLDLAGLPPADRALVTQYLADRLTAALTDRFASGARPPGFTEIPASVHAGYLAGGLTQLLLADSPDPATAAALAWPLIAPHQQA